MKAASTPSSIPFSENEAASGTVPYMQSGEATPIALAANIEKRPRDMRVKSALSRSFANTETTEPPTIPAAQKGAMSRSTIQKWRQKYMNSFSMRLSPFARCPGGYFISL